ncbi:MAG: hypothetical protein KDK99_00960 [Verrucomicrobiales bacterium]|nr:hypothetical protein [Verrucomicrobiales bacterium]
MKKNKIPAMKRRSRLSLLLPLWLLASADLTQAQVDAAAFLHRAKEVLPEEKPYAYHERLAQGPVHEPLRAPDAAAAASEMTVADTGWTVVLSDKADPVVEFAAADLKEFLHASMNVEVSLQKVADLSAALKQEKVIIAATRDELEGLGTDLATEKDFQLQVSPQRIVVCGAGPRGVMHGLFDVEARMGLRGGPFLPQDLSLTRRSLYQNRMAISWLGFMQWPDTLLSHLAHDGFDAVFASVYANPNGLPGPPHYDIIRKQTPARMNDLIRRAAAKGLKVYTPILFNNLRDEENQQALREHVRDLVTKFPGIRGYVLLTEGFFFEKFFGAGGHGKQDLREWAQHWSRAVKIVTEEAHAIDPAIEILPWEYNIDFRPSRVELKRYVTSLLPQDSIPLLTWENGKAFELDGFQGFLRDYSISQVGPAEVSVGQIEEAKRRGMKVYCKADSFATWQFGTTPYVPCPQQWQRRYDKEAEYGIDGTLETWSNGYKPNFQVELRRWSCWSNPPDFEDLLRGVARRQFGGSVEEVLAAWSRFSEAIQLVPDTGPSMGTNSAVAMPLFFDEPPPRIMTLRNSWWDDAQKFHWRHRLVEYWPFAHHIMVFQPDFTNRSNRAEAYARQRSGIGFTETPADEKAKSAEVLPVFLKYVNRAADQMEEGLRPYRAAAMAAPAMQRQRAFHEVLIVEQMQRMLRSLHAILEFEDLRFRLMTDSDATAADPRLQRMLQILEEEIPRTQQSLETARLDSRLGYESEMDYVYTPFVLEQKLEVLRKVRDREIPAWKAAH